MLYVEYRDWVEYYTVEPWGCEVEDQRSAILVSAIFQAQGVKTVSPQTIHNAYYDRDGSRHEREARRARQSAAELEARMDRYFDEWNAKQEATPN